jgi:hypothetical protein
MSESVRDHGYGDSPEVVGVPRVVQKVLLSACPNCGCETVYLIEVHVKNERLKGGEGVGNYVGCPACPWASPMMSRAT